MTYALVYAFMTLGAFGVVIGLGQRGENLVGYHGLAATAPGKAALMFLFLLSLTGIPPTAGFAAKFAVILSAVRAGYIVLAVLAVLCSVVSGARGIGAGTLSGCGVRSTCGRRVCHCHRGDFSRHLRGMDGATVIPTKVGRRRRLARH